MATATPLNHPSKAAQSKQFFPYRVTIKRTLKNGEQPVVGLAENLPCFFDPALGGESGTFADEAPSSDKILLPTWEPLIKSNDLAVLDLNGTTKRRTINDVVPLGNGPDQTLLVVTPA